MTKTLPIEQIPPEFWEQAAARLAGAGPDDPVSLGQPLIEAAPSLGIDWSLFWGTIDRTNTKPRVVQVCLGVPGPGRTAMLFVSGPAGVSSVVGEHEQRVRLIGRICELLARRGPVLAQALPEPIETWAVDAYRAADFIPVGTLDYLRVDLPKARPTADRTFGDGIIVRPVRGIDPGQPDRRLLMTALERSYEQTLDCPALCGLRETADVLESHRATGQWDPSLWWLVLADDEPHGCLLLNRCPEQGAVELVYIGLSPKVRGRGLSGRLLAMGLAEIHARGDRAMICAVDRRNAPAKALYRRLGFRRFASREAFVRAV